MNYLHFQLLSSAVTTQPKIYFPKTYQNQLQHNIYSKTTSGIRATFNNLFWAISAVIEGQFKLEDDIFYWTKFQCFTLYYSNL